MDKLSTQINNLGLRDIYAHQEGDLVSVTVQGNLEYTQKVAKLILTKVPKESKIWIANEELEIYGDINSIANN